MAIVCDLSFLQNAAFHLPKFQILPSEIQVSWVIWHSYWLISKLAISLLFSIADIFMFIHKKYHVNLHWHWEKVASVPTISVIWDVEGFRAIINCLILRTVKCITVINLTFQMHFFNCSCWVLFFFSLSLPKNLSILNILKGRLKHVSTGTFFPPKLLVVYILQVSDFLLMQNFQVENSDFLRCIFLSRNRKIQEKIREIHDDVFYLYFFSYK